MAKRGKDMQKLEAVMSQLINEFPLDLRNRGHKLQGKFTDRRECHIESDWLLIYKLDANEITFERTGSHTDLFE
ncbi:MAG TPA: type II toxin-antitoxin system YafQ family toxin [Candidatus Kapabacteria bacterium]|nr:type II toxin-antitoxin system YafQ family toxin [Candidatus Kapabacteria bacterium]